MPKVRWECTLFEDFLTVCKVSFLIFDFHIDLQGTNTPYIQCVRTDDDGIAWFWAEEKFKKEHANICNWMQICFDMGTAYFDLMIIITRKQF